MDVSRAARTNVACVGSAIKRAQRYMCVLSSIIQPTAIRFTDVPNCPLGRLVMTHDNFAMPTLHYPLDLWVSDLIPNITIF